MEVVSYAKMSLICLLYYRNILITLNWQYKKQQHWAPPLSSHLHQYPGLFQHAVDTVGVGAGILNGETNGKKSIFKQQWHEVFEICVIFVYHSLLPQCFHNEVITIDFYVVFNHHVVHCSIVLKCLSLHDLLHADSLTIGTVIMQKVEDTSYFDCHQSTFLYNTPFMKLKRFSIFALLSTIFFNCYSLSGSYTKTRNSPSNPLSYCTQFS